MHPKHACGSGSRKLPRAKRTIRTIVADIKLTTCKTMSFSYLDEAISFLKSSRAEWIAANLGLSTNGFLDSASGQSASCRNTEKECTKNVCETDGEQFLVGINFIMILGRKNFAQWNENRSGYHSHTKRASENIWKVLPGRWLRMGQSSWNGSDSSNLPNFVKLHKIGSDRSKNYLQRNVR